MSARAAIIVRTSESTRARNSAWHTAASGELLQQARQNKIPDSAWPTVAASLAGSYIQYGNKIFDSTVPAVNWTAEEIVRRKALLSDMLAATSNPAGQKAIQEALVTVSRRVPRR